NLIDWRSSCEEDHQLGMLQPRSPDLLAVYHVALALPDRDGLDPGGVATGAGLGDAHRLQAQLAGGDFRQVFLFLRLRAVAQHRVVVAAEVHFFGLRWADASSSIRSQISSAIGERDSSSRCPTSPTARAITPSPRHTFQSKPSSHASAPIAPVAFSVMFLSF